MSKKKKKNKGKKRSNGKKQSNQNQRQRNQNKDNQTKKQAVKSSEKIEKEELLKKENVEENAEQDNQKNKEEKTKRNNKQNQKKSKKENKITKDENKKKKLKQENRIENADTKTKKRISGKLFIAIGLIILIASGNLAYLIIKPKFKDIQIELGTKEIKVEDFLTSKIYKSKSEFVTDISQIDLSQVGEYEIILKFLGKEHNVKLKVADTKAPEVIFRDITKYIDYEINPEDFIESKKDESEMMVELIEKPEITNFGDYKVKIKVKDKYQNETEKECILSITWIKPEVYVELGNEITLQDLVFNVEEYGESVSKTDFENINTLVIGEYIVKAEKDGNQYETKVIVRDTTPPILELKNITIYDDETINDYTSFITTLSDISGTPTTTLKTEINYDIVGTQEIVIEAVDVNGNKSEATAILTIKKDNDGPSIYGLNNMTVNKYAGIDYLAGVSANDKKDGRCEVTVDSSNVNTSVAGTYYATYYAKDTKGNTTTAKRRITVNHDQDDTNAKMNEFYNNYCAGKDIVGIASAVREHIKYNSNWGGDDPVWYGLTEGKGNCYVHANVLKRALEKAGYQNSIIYLTDQSHYWNLVYVNGVWRHIDGTPSANHTLGLLTDEQKLADPGVHQKTWNREAWPAAE